MKTTRALLSGGPADGRLLELDYPPMRYQFLQIPMPSQCAQATYRARGVDLNRSAGWHVLYEFVK